MSPFLRNHTGVWEVETDDLIVYPGHPKANPELAPPQQQPTQSLSGAAYTIGTLCWGGGGGKQQPVKMMISAVEVCGSRIAKQT